MKNVVILLAAGKSKRCGFDKLLEEYQGSNALEKCITTFTKSALIDDIWIVGPKAMGASDKIKGQIEGGSERFYSLEKALTHCAKTYNQNVRIIVHNAANPNLNQKDLEAGIQLAETRKNVIFGYFTPNSLKEITDGKVSNFLDRDKIFETQTPQISDLDTFKKALKAWGSNHEKENILPKDEAELLTLIDEDIFVYECDPHNTKITYASDFLSKNRIGIGEDSHRFSSDFDPEKPFRLGGIDVSNQELSSDGNSDGDLILHALCNALLSAHGDRTFDPIADPICKAGDTSSTSYLKATLEHLGHPSITQVLVSLEGAQPKIAPHHEKIQANLAQLLSLDPQKVGLTYTTGEGLSEFGKGIGMKSSAIVILAS